MSAKFIRLKVRTARIVHGFDAQNAEIIEEPLDEAYTIKLVAIDRIQSISERYLLVTGGHGRLMYWEYKGGMDALAQRLAKAGLLLE
ncbi:hypothetical protein JCM19000A_01180 [Silvimonas sp. JCM 19000]